LAVNGTGVAVLRRASAVLRQIADRRANGNALDVDLVLRMRRTLNNA
jgi:hypothetical protein